MLPGILHPTDFSEPINAALAQAIEFARLLGAAPVVPSEAPAWAEPREVEPETGVGE